MSSLVFLIFWCSQVLQLLLMSLCLTSAFPRSSRPTGSVAYCCNGEKRFGENMESFILPTSLEKLKKWECTLQKVGPSQEIIWSCPQGATASFFYCCPTCFSGGSVERGTTRGAANGCASQGRWHTPCGRSAEWARLGWYRLTQPIWFFSWTSPRNNGDPCQKPLVTDTVIHQ